MAENIVTRVPLIGVLTPADMCGYVVESKYIQGGYIVVQTIAERNALTSKATYEYNNVLQNGCPVYVAEERKTYRYEITDRGPTWTLDNVDLTPIQKEINELVAADSQLSKDLEDFKSVVSLTLSQKADKTELNNYATKDDLANVNVDLTGYATETYVQNAVKNIALPDLDAIEQDIENVDTKVENLKKDVNSISRDYMRESDGEAVKVEAVNNAKAYTDTQVTVINNTKADKSALNDYYTKTESDSYHNAKVDWVTYNADKVTFATKNELAGEVSELESEIAKTNAAVSTKIDSTALNNYYVKADVDAKDSAINNKFASYYTKEETAQQISTATASYVTKDTDQLVNYTTTASLNAKFDAIEQDIENVEAELAGHAIKADVDAEIAAIRSSIPTKSSQLDNDSGYLTEHQSLEGYATEQYVDSKVEAITVPTKVSDLENDKNYLTAVPSEYVTETELSNKGYLTQHQSLDAYAKKEDVTAAISVKADDVLFTDTYFVTKAIGNFVGDGTESLQGMTIREIFVKILGATLKAVYDSIIDQIIAEQIPMLSGGSTSDHVVEYSYTEMTEEEAAKDTTLSSFYQIKDSDGNVKESGYQVCSEATGRDVYSMAIPSGAVIKAIYIYDLTLGWVEFAQTLTKTETVEVNNISYDVYVSSDSSSDDKYRFVIE